MLLYDWEIFSLAKNPCTTLTQHDCKLIIIVLCIPFFCFSVLDRFKLSLFTDLPFLKQLLKNEKNIVV